MSASLQRIEVAPDLTEMVYKRLLEAIGSGALAPGTRITQEELAASLNVSRQPVVQALRMLKMDGVAIPAGRRGLIIAPVDPELIGQLYAVRGVLEGLAAREAARAHASIDPGIIERGRRAVASGRIAAMIDADLAFHNALYIASGNPLIAESAVRHWPHFRRAMGSALQAASVRATVWDEHQAIIDAINAGDAAEAERRAREHCEVAGRVLVNRLKEGGRAVPSRRSTSEETT